MLCYAMYSFMKRCGKGKKLEVSWNLFYLIPFLSFSMSRLRWQIEALATSHGSVAWCRLDLEWLTWFRTKLGVSFLNPKPKIIPTRSMVDVQGKDPRSYGNQWHVHGNPWHISPRDVGSLVMPQAPWAPWAPCPTDAARIPRRPRAATAVPAICRRRHRGVPVLIVLGHDNHDP